MGLSQRSCRRLVRGYLGGAIRRSPNVQKSIFGSMFNVRIHSYTTKWKGWRNIFVMSSISVSLLASCTKSTTKNASDRDQLPVAQPIPKKVTEVLPSKAKMPKPFSCEASKGRTECRDSSA